jgi:hypothetical protein
MRRILLISASAAVLALPAAAGARAGAGAVSGYLVVRNAAADGGVTGRPVVTVVVDGFVLGRVSQEGRVYIYHLASGAGAGAPQVAGVDVSRRAVNWHGVPGTEFTGSGFRFRAVGGVYRVVVRGSGVYVFAAGRGRVTLRGSVAYPQRDGQYAIGGAEFRSLPAHALTRSLGRH